MHPSGLKEVMVWRPKDLEGIDSKTQAARIAHTVGENKRVQIVDEAKKANIRILNPGLKKPAEIAPETLAEPTEGAVETPTESAIETTEEPTPKPETKETEKPAKKEAKKRRTGKSGKKRSKK
jgi:large subunit ribosomal protein L32e